MKIISWNCGGKFREKFQYIAEFDADIYIIQECESPIDYPSHSYSSFATNYLWTGERNCKGLGVFAKPYIRLQLNDWEKYCLRNSYPSMLMDNSISLLCGPADLILKNTTSIKI